MKRFFALLAAFTMECSGARADLPRGIFTLYSDLCLHRQSGDVLGTRIGFLNIRGGTYIFYQASAGELEAPQIMPLPDGQLAKSQFLRFSAKTFSGTDQFSGVVTPQAIDGNFQGAKTDDFGKGGRDMHLPKVDPQAGLPYCK